MADDQDGRICHEITDEACREKPGNFFKLLASQTLTKTGDRLASAKTTLPWILSSLGSPAWCISLLVPIRESGSMLPQMVIGAYVRRMALRKWVWVAGSCGEGTALLLMGAAALTMEGLPLGLTILTLLGIFALSRGAASIASKDVLGKTIPKTRRGRLSGWMGAIAGFSAMLAGAGIGFFAGDDAPVLLYAGILFAAAFIWFLAALIFAQIREFPGATDGGVSGLKEGLAKLSLLRDDAHFRRFVIARALAVGSGLAAPFYITLAQRDLSGSALLLGIFIAVEGLSGLISSPLWGRYADRSSRHVFAYACGGAAVLSLMVAIWSLLPASTLASYIFYPIAFFGLGLAHAGVRLGRKTYIIDLAEGNQRTDYVAVSNTVMGALLLASGLIGALTALVSVAATVILLSVAGLIGAYLALRLKPVSGVA